MSDLSERVYSKKRVLGVSPLDKNTKNDLYNVLRSRQYINVVILILYSRILLAGITWKDPDACYFQTKRQITLFVNF